MNARPLLLIGTLATFVVAGGIYMRARAGHAEARAGLAANDTKASSAELADLRNEVGRLRGQVGGLAWQQAQAARDAPAPAQANPDASAAPALSREEADAQWEQRHREYLNGLESSFQSERLETQWSTESTGAIRAALDAPGVGLKASQIDCRSKTCRMEVPLDDAGKNGKAMPLFANALAGSLPSMVADYRDEAGGGKTMILYLSSTIERPTNQPGGG
jgi:hypothetical protein